MHDGRRFEGGADDLIGALHFEGGGHDPAHLANTGPFFGQISVFPRGWRLRDVFEMHRAIVSIIPLQPDLLHREHEDRGEPCRQAVKEDIQHGARRTAVGRIAVTIERVFADIEIEGGEIDGRKGKDRLPDRVEIIGLIGGANGLIELSQTVQHPALQLRHIRRFHAICLCEISQ